MKKTWSVNLFWQGIVGKLSILSFPQIQAPGRVFSIALLFVCLAVNLYVRCFPAYLPVLRKVARLNVLERHIKDPEKQPLESAKVALHDAPGAVEAKTPKAPQEDLLEEIEREYAKLKDPYQDEKGLTYLMEFDPYAWARLTGNMIHHGFPGDEKNNGINYDRLGLAPFGTALSFQQFFCYLTNFFERVRDVFPSVSLAAFFFYVPVIYALFFLVLLFFFVRKWSTDLTASLAVLLVGLVPKIILRSSAGWFDTDSLNAILALAIGWSLAEGSSEGRSLKGAVAFSMLAGIFQGIFVLAWGGWWFMGVVALAFYALLFLADLKNREAVPGRIARAAVLLASYVLVTFVFAYGLAGVNVFAVLGEFLRHEVCSGMGSVGLGAGNIWPDTFKTVAELAPVGFREIVRGFFGYGIFALSAVGFGVMAVAGWRGRTRPFVILLLCWFFFMLVASFKSNRFIFFLAIPFFILAAVFWGNWMPQKLPELRSSLKRLLGGAVFLACILFMVLGVIRRGIAHAESIFPLMNDSWHKALIWLADSTPPDSIANAWWDYGYWIKYYGKRRVVFDNGTQTGQLSYWMARVLTSRDEREALSILRMLDNASDQTFGKLLSHFHDPFRAQTVLEQLFKMDAAGAEKALKEWGVPGSVAGDVLGALYKKPAPAYLIVEGTMWQKIPSISSLSSWNIPKLFVLREREKTPAAIQAGLENILGLSPPDAEKIRKEVLGEREAFKNPEKQLSAPVRFYKSKMIGKREGTLVHFNGGLIVDPVSKDALIYVPRSDTFRVLKKVLWVEEGQKREFLKPKGNDPRVALVIRNGEEYRAVLADKGLEESLFVRLMLEGGVGLDHFRTVYSDPEHELYIYEISW